MALVNPEYRGELAVLSTWLCALLPWSVTVWRPSSVTAFWIRYPPGRFLYVLGAKLPGDNDPYLWVWDVQEFVATKGESDATTIWMAAGLLFLLAVVLSVSYYANEEEIKEILGDPAGILGGLLVLSGLVFGVAVVIQMGTLPGYTIPIGLLFQLALGTVILQTPAP
jgi:uncharacterized protein (TIGR04206 family)